MFGWNLLRMKQTQGWTLRACRYFNKVSAVGRYGEPMVSSSSEFQFVQSHTASTERRTRRNDIWRGWDVGINLNKNVFNIIFFRLLMKCTKETESTHVWIDTRKQVKMHTMRWEDVECKTKRTDGLKWSPRRGRQKKKRIDQNERRDK